MSQSDSDVEDRIQREGHARVNTARIGLQGIQGIVIQAALGMTDDELTEYLKALEQAAKDLLPPRRS